MPVVSNPQVTHRSKSARLSWLALLLFAAFLALYWAHSVHTALRVGVYGHPVSIELAGDVPGARVERISPSGRAWPMVHVPDTGQWVTSLAWFRDVRIHVPESQRDTLEAVHIRIGPRSETFDREALLSQWTEVRGDVGYLVYDTSPITAVSPSRIGKFTPLFNWPGDAAVLRRVLLSPFLGRLLVILTIGALLLAYQRATSPGQERIERGVRGVVLAALGVYVIGMVLPVVWSRFSFPLSIEHLEGSLSSITWKWIHGGTPYPEPSLEAASSIYTPAYYMLSRAWVGVFGHTLPALRGLTLLLMFATAGASAYIVKLLGGTWRLGLLWIPLYWLMFDYYAWIDNANKETLHVFLATAGLAVLLTALEPSRGWAFGRCVLVGLFWAGAFMTKQSHVIQVVPVFFALLIYARPQMWIAGLSFSFFTCAFMGWAYLTWGHIFWEWVFVVPGGHGIRTDQFVVIALSFTACGIGFITIPIIYLLWLRRSPHTMHPGAVNQPAALPDSLQVANVRLYAVVATFALGCLLIALMSAGKDRGGDYAFVQPVAAFSLFIVLAIREMRGTPAVCALLLLLLPMTLPFDRSITERDQAAAQRLIDAVAAEPGEVWVPAHPWVNIAAGKKSYVAINDLGEWQAAGQELPFDLAEPLAANHFSLIVTDFNLPYYAQARLDRHPYDIIAEHYTMDELYPWEDSFVIKDGWRKSPRMLWRANEE
jgi:hypothetical protein